MNPLVSGAIWLSFYLGIVLAPVAILLIAPTPPGGGFWWDVSMGLGFAGLTMMAVQFVLTARFKRATAPSASTSSTPFTATWRTRYWLSSSCIR